MLCTPHQYEYYSGDKIKNNEMGRASSHMGKGEVYTGLWRENLRGDHLEDTSVDGRIILKWIFEKWNREHRMDRFGSG